LAKKKILKKRKKKKNEKNEKNEKPNGKKVTPNFGLPRPSRSGLADG
jgi:hypothetical protein